MCPGHSGAALRRTGHSPRPRPHLWTWRVFQVARGSPGPEGKETGLKRGSKCLGAGRGPWGRRGRRKAAVCPLETACPPRGLRGEDARTRADPSRRATGPSWAQAMWDHSTKPFLGLGPGHCEGRSTPERRAEQRAGLPRVVCWTRAREPRPRSPPAPRGARDVWPGLSHWASGLLSRERARASPEGQRRARK